MQSGPEACGPVPSLLTPTAAAANIQALHVWRRPVSAVAASRDRAAKYFHEELLMIPQIIVTRMLWSLCSWSIFFPSCTTVNKATASLQ